MRWTKGKYAFIVATHIDWVHIHNHIIYNSTSLDCTRKFKDFFLSGLAVQKLSDRICAEYGLSCRRHIGNERKERFIRLHSLDDEYSEDAIRAVISGKTLHKTKNISKQVHTQRDFHLLIDIQAKMAEGKSAGYECWAKKYNHKEAARTVCLLKEKGVASYEELTALTDKLSSRFNELSGSIKSAEKRMIEIGTLKKHINNYAKRQKEQEQQEQDHYRCFHS